MERKTIRDGNGNVRLRCSTLEAFNCLADYEDVEEQGLLIRLPCKVGDTVYRIWKVDGRESVISTHRFDTVAHIVEWLPKFGKTIFLTREEAEAALAKED